MGLGTRQEHGTGWSSKISGNIETKGEQDGFRSRFVPITVSEVFNIATTPFVYVYNIGLLKLLSKALS